MSPYTIIILFIPLVIAVCLIVRSTILSKKHDIISHNVRGGNICYSCKENIIENSFDFYYGDDVKLTLCKSCNRDEKLNSLTHIRLISITAIKKFIYKFNNKILIASTIFMLLGFIVEFTIRYLYNIETRLGTITNSIYLLITWYKTELSYRTKRDIF